MDSTDYRVTTVGLSGGGLTLGISEAGPDIQYIPRSSSPVESDRRIFPTGIKKPLLTGAGQGRTDISRGLQLTPTSESGQGAGCTQPNAWRVLSCA